MGYESDIATTMLNLGCCFCNTPLRVPESIQRGYGPECDNKYMAGEGLAAVMRRMESMFDPKEAAEAIRSAPDVVPVGWIEPTKVAKKGDLIEVPNENGEPVRVQAGGGEILDGRPINPGSLREYFTKHGGDPDDPTAPWRTDAEVRRQLVSYGIWYASRAARWGFQGSQTTANKVDARFLVISAVQRFARAVGLPAVADQMANFWAARVVVSAKEVSRAVLGERAREMEEREELLKRAIIFETDVPPAHPLYRRTAGPGMMRIHAPFNEEYNRLARENRDVFVAWEKEGPYFFRYFHQKHLRKVINLCQSAFGDAVPSLTRPFRGKAEVEAQLARERNKVAIVDSWTGEVRLFDRQTATRLLEEQPTAGIAKARLRFQKV